MAGESDKKAVGDTVGDVPALSDTEKTKDKKKKKGLLSRVWNGILRHGDDLEKRLQHISKEEAATLSRLKWRAQWWRKMTRHLIVLSIFLEVVAVGYAIMTTRSSDLNWKSRAFRVLPMFLLPALSFASHWALGSSTRMLDNRDRKTLERLRAERQAKIDELKEKTNYYTTQQLIQRYDTDPAAKAAAATVLASKLGADSGLKVYLGDESKLNSPKGKSNDVELAQTSGLRNRKQLHTRANSADGTLTVRPEVDTLYNTGLEGPENTPRHQMAVEHFQPTGSSTHDQGWLAKLAALLVGEDPSQSYALICGNCHMHNGLARKEDFPYITYYCPHCNALNRPKHQDERSSGCNSPNMNSSVTGSTGAEEVIKNVGSSMIDGMPSGSPVAATAAAAADTETDKALSEASGS